MHEKLRMDHSQSSAYMRMYIILFLPNSTFNIVFRFLLHFFETSFFVTFKHIAFSVSSVFTQCYLFQTQAFQLPVVFFLLAKPWAWVVDWGAISLKYWLCGCAFNFFLLLYNQKMKGKLISNMHPEYSRHHIYDRRVTRGPCYTGYDYILSGLKTVACSMALYQRSSEVQRQKILGKEKPLLLQTGLPQGL